MQWYLNVQNTFNVLHHNVSWWHPGLFAVICVPAAAWIIGYLLVGFDWFDFDACMQMGRMIAFYTLPTVYALWFALPYAGVEIFLLAAFVAGLAFLSVRGYKKYMAKAIARDRRNADPDTPKGTKKHDMVNVIRGGRQ